jgi:hypothetical protein
MGSPLRIANAVPVMRVSERYKMPSHEGDRAQVSDFFLHLVDAKE